MFRGSLHRSQSRGETRQGSLARGQSHTQIGTVLDFAKVQNPESLGVSPMPKKNAKDLRWGEPHSEGISFCAGTHEKASKLEQLASKEAKLI